MGLMIFGQKFDIGDCFIVLSNCRKSEMDIMERYLAISYHITIIMWHFVHVICCK